MHEIVCEYGSKYVGETGRPLAARITEHMGASTNPSLKSYVDAPLAKHRVAHHRCIPKVAVRVLQVAVNTIARKALEGVWIKREKPEMNGKEEMEEALSLFA